jgi:hypothetical protein
MFGKFQLLFERSRQALKKARELRLLRSSSLFDESWYLANNPDIAQAKVDPCDHYLRYGGFEGRDPGPGFNSLWYLANNADVRAARINPLLHYLEYGRNENRKIKTRKHALIKSIQNWADNGSKFPIPDQAIIEKIRPEMKNWNESKIKIVQRDGKLWVIKKCGNYELVQRELLIYSLARGLVNAAEVKTLSFENCKELSSLGLLPLHSSPYNTLLVRLAQDYAIDELPQKNLDGAVAGEFVFSLWVRRHDIHMYNHSNTKDGIPVFFDLNISLNCVAGMVDVVQFFERPAEGSPSHWRVHERGNTPPTPFGFRKKIDCDIIIDSVDGFNKAVTEITGKIVSQDLDLKSLVEKAGYIDEEIDELTRFIATTSKTLPGDVKKMLKVIIRESQLNMY